MGPTDLTSVYLAVSTALLMPFCFLNDKKILYVIGWVSTGDDFDNKPINFHRRRNPPSKVNNINDVAA
jgi:hypothetical protein